MPSKYIQPKAIAERWESSIANVMRLIKSGELTAIMIGSAGSQKPRYRVSIEELERFETGRTTKPVEPTPAPVQRVTRRKQESDVITFFRGGKRVKV